MPEMFMSSPKPGAGVQEIFIGLYFYRQVANNAEILILAFVKIVI